ncbi:hypothetical protein MsAg5_11790 [Methanosarcinaceae archaeon Ag5]|uniref:Uncharacterized protein n=1 Tax=Methanolapillus africanus TaxID=3028297 RepID=A0AAE4SD92_9EURY|nr:hypothetical protein [Methanosarcinaceae archaeon Ag5]
MYSFFVLAGGMRARYGDTFSARSKKDFPRRLILSFGNRTLISNFEFKQTGH